jgi:tetratricopeptide (TPR) repeat protein
VNRQSFESLRQRVDEALSEKRVAEARELLESRAAQFQSGARREERRWFRRSYGYALCHTGDRPTGMAELGRAYAMEPRDRDVAMTYSRYLLDDGHWEQALQIMQGLIVQHKSDLRPKQLGSVYRWMGELFQREGRLDWARAAFDQALTADPGERTALDGLLGTIRGFDDPEQAVRSRQVLLRRLSEPAAVARVLEAQGDDLRDKLEDSQGALSAYVEALAVTPGAAPLLRKKAEVLEAMGHVEAAAETFLQLVDAATEMSRDDKLAVLERAQALLADAPHGQQKRVDLLNAVLDLQPERLDLFEELTRACGANELWEALADSYKRMIARLQAGGSESGARAMPILWRNLGELLFARLDRPDEAYEALVVACRLLPKDVDLRKKAIALCYDRDDRLVQALQLARELCTLAPEDNENLERYAGLLLKAGRYDEALCVLRVLRVASPDWSPRLERHYQRLQRTGMRLPQRTLTAEHRHHLLRSPSQSPIIDSLMTLGAAVFNKVFAHDLPSLGLSERDRFDLTGDTMFARLYNQIASVLEIKDVPRVYLHKACSGMANAVLAESAFVIGPDMLAGRTEREVAFIIAQQLTLTRGSYILATVQQPMHLNTVVVAMVSRIEPSVNVQPSPDIDRLHREMDKQLRGDLQGHLARTVQALLTQETGVNMEQWVQLVADAANRTGLVLCDDLETASRMLEEHPGVLAPGRVSDRRTALHRFGASDAYFSLRNELGISIKAS